MLREKTFKNMSYFYKLSFLESYAMFMGKTQLIEFSLKRILSLKYRYGKKKLDKMTLGGVISELEKLGIRKDFILVLRELNKLRINMAHDFLVEHFALTTLDRRYGRFSLKPLRHAIFWLEQTVHVFNFLNQNKYLYKGQRKVY